jgi:hypothetical protein
MCLIGAWIAGCNGNGPIGAQSALDTPYDNSSSTLGADNVQDAIDELAARPLPEAPLRDRFYFGPWLVSDQPTAPNITLGVECGGDEMVVSVSCDYQPHGWPTSGAAPILQAAYVEGLEPKEGVGICAWGTPDGLVPTGTFRARALCLRL